MKLDERILPGKRPLGCFDTEEAREFIGKEGYFCRYEHLFSDAKKIGSTSVLAQIKPEDPAPFVPQIAIDRDQPYAFEYFLPAEWVTPEEPENKWRPFTLDDFVKRFDLEIGTRVFLIRSKRKPENMKRLLLTGIIQDKDPDLCGIGLGPYFFKFAELFNFYEVKIGKKDWQPFGVEEASE